MTCSEHGPRPGNRKIFDIPQGDSIRNFSEVQTEVSEIPLKKDSDGNMSLTASFTVGSKTRKVIASSVSLKHGNPHNPRLIYGPLHDGRSIGTYRYLGLESPEWNHEGIDISHDSTDLNFVHQSATATQYSYALGMRMFGERIKEAHNSGQPVGLIVISYGANIAGAFLSTAGELPEAVVTIAGGTILETMLESEYSRTIDDNVLAMLRQNPGLLPTQKPLPIELRERCAAVINNSDEVVKGQEKIWGIADTKMYLEGSHASALTGNKLKIREFAINHLRKTLAA